MDKAARQAILIMIDNIEKQLVGVKTMLGLTLKQEYEHRTANLEEKGPLNYTSDKEDLEIEQAIAVEANEKEKFLQDLFTQANDT